MKYSLSLHNEKDERLRGFDNAHSVREGNGPCARTRIEYDHKHKGERVRFYEYQNAATLLEEEEEQPAMTTLRVGILPLEEYKRRTIKIALGEYVPAPDEPKVWFQSLEALSQVLSHKNRALLALIETAQPQSISELAGKSGRALSNLSRTLKTMERYGLVRFEKGQGREVAPRVNYSGIQLEVLFQ